MLAAECAWAILRAEHAQTRQLLVQLVASMPPAADPAPRQHAAAAMGIVRRLPSFENATHRPKGVVMLGLLRGRSSQADALLDELDAESKQCAEMLSQAMSLLTDADRGDMSAARAAVALLQQHRRLMFAHLHKEDTLLHSQTAELLTPEEWAAIVSSISREVGAASAREQRRSQAKAAPQGPARRPDELA